MIDGASIQESTLVALAGRWEFVEEGSRMGCATASKTGRIPRIGPKGGCHTVRILLSLTVTGIDREAVVCTVAAKGVVSRNKSVGRCGYMMLKSVISCRLAA
jgi:hypothetical protein